jgi:hypothetical protein
MEILHKQLDKMFVSVCVSLCEGVGHITLRTRRAARVKRGKNS